MLILTAEIQAFTPSIITAGLNAQWKLTFPDYLYADSWVATVYIIGNGIQYTITGTATSPASSYHLFTKLASETSAYIAGDYKYKIIVVNGTSKWQMEEGRISILPNFISETGIYSKSENETILALLKKGIKELASKTTSQVTVDGVSYTRMTLNEMIKASNHYQFLVNQEIAAEQLSQGFPDPNKKYVRFTPR